MAADDESVDLAANRSWGLETTSHAVRPIVFHVVRSFGAQQEICVNAYRTASRVLMNASSDLITSISCIFMITCVKFKHLYQINFLKRCTENEMVKLAANGSDKATGA